MLVLTLLGLGDVLRKNQKRAQLCMRSNGGAAVGSLGGIQLPPLAPRRLVVKLRHLGLSAMLRIQLGDLSER